jgi:hypothetical protein
MVMNCQIVAVYVKGLNDIKTSVRIFRTVQNNPRSELPSTSRNSYTIPNVCEMETQDRRLTLRMMPDELKRIRRQFVKSPMKIYGRGRFVQSSSHTDSRMRGSSGDTHRAKTLSRLVKIIPVFLMAL